MGIILSITLIFFIGFIVSLLIVYHLNNQIEQKNLEIKEKDAQIEAFKINLLQYHRKIDDYENECCHKDISP